MHANEFRRRPTAEPFMPLTINLSDGWTRTKAG